MMLDGRGNGRGDRPTSRSKIEFAFLNEPAGGLVGCLNHNHEGWFGSLVCFLTFTSMALSIG